MFIFYISNLDDTKNFGRAGSLNGAGMPITECMFPSSVQLLQERAFKLASGGEKDLLKLDGWSRPRATTSQTSSNQ